MPPQYQNAKIYKLVSNKTADVYIGSCLVDLCKRLGVHKAPTNACSSRKMFVDDAIITIVLIEALPECKSKAEMKARELFHITNNACININKPFVTETVYGAEWISEYDKEYYKANAEHKKEQFKEYRKANAEKIKENKKEYRKAHAEKIKEQRKEYYKANYAKKKAQKLITETLGV